MAREPITGTVTASLADPAMLHQRDAAAIVASAELSIPIAWFEAYPWLLTFETDGSITVNASNGPFSYSVVGMAKDSRQVISVWADLNP